MGMHSSDGKGREQTSEQRKNDWVATLWALEFWIFSILIEYVISQKKIMAWLLDTGESEDSFTLKKAEERLCN